jgi:putative hydrolase of the HAD superfamily
MIEAAVALTGGALRGADVQAIIDTGRGMAHQPIDFLPGAHEALGQLGLARALALVTKGDLLDQERKVAKSGLGGWFRHIEILTDKTPATYAALFSRLGVDPARFLMVGNSLRSDILPVLELGGWAVHVPYELTWAHESAGEVPPDTGRFFEIQHLGELSALVARIESQG